MAIAMIDPTLQAQIDSRIDRTNRFKDKVQQLMEMINNLTESPIISELSAKTEETFQKPEISDIAMQQPKEPVQQVEQAKGLTADDIDLDDLISDIRMDEDDLQP